MYNNKLLIRTYTGTYTEIFLNACCTHKNCRFGEVSFLAPVYKSSRISATQRPIRNKFGTNVEKGRLVRNPQKKWKFFVPTYGPFPRGRSHMYVHYVPQRSICMCTMYHKGLYVCALCTTKVYMYVHYVPQRSICMCTMYHKGLYVCALRMCTIYHKGLYVCAYVCALCTTKVYMYVHYVPQRSICMCTMYHKGLYVCALCTTKVYMYVHYVPQRSICMCTMYHKGLYVCALCTTKVYMYVHYAPQRSICMCTMCHKGLYVYVHYVPQRSICMCTMYHKGLYNVYVHYVPQRSTVKPLMLASIIFSVLPYTTF